jgi:CHAD domain-containing protein
MAQSHDRDGAPAEASQFVVEQAHRQLRQLTSQLNRATKSCSADAVHQVRVAIRRFTQSIVVGKPCFHLIDVRKNRQRMKKIMAAAGEVRNCDVALKFIAKSRAPEAVHLQSKLESRRKESARLLITNLKTWTDRRMSLKWRAALNEASAANDDAPREAAHDLARRALSRIAKDFLKQGNEASSTNASPHGMHRFRIAAKKFRYALELFQPLYGSSVERRVASIKGASALLGDVNDCVTVAGILKEYKRGNRLAHQLKKRQSRRTEEFRKYWKEAFSDGEQLQSWVDRLEPLGLGGLKKPAASTSAASRRKSVA